MLFASTKMLLCMVHEMKSAYNLVASGRETIFDYCGNKVNSFSLAKKLTCLLLYFTILCNVCTYIFKSLQFDYQVCVWPLG